MFIKTLLATLSLGIISGTMTSAKNVATPESVKPSFANISLQDSVPLPSAVSEKMVTIPFGKTTRKQVVNDNTVINPSEFLEYDNISDVAEMLIGRVPGADGLNLRGLGAPLVIIDGMPRAISSVNIHEVEQITVLKDVNASILYGVQANNGVILIKTKRGKVDSKVISGLFETGFADPISFPNYLGSAEYMELYNEARVNDGLAPLYTQQAIDGTRDGSNPIRYPDLNYYSPEFLKKSKPVSRLVTEFSGGNENAQYYLNLGWERSGSLMNKGGDNLHDDRLNIRSNIDFSINKFIKSYIGIAGVFNLSNTPTGNFFSDASSLRPNLFPGLIDTALISNEALRRTATLVEGGYVVGGTSLYQTNPYGYLNLGGFNKNLGIAVQFTNGLQFDLGSLTEGLSLSTHVSFDFTNRYSEFQTNTYAVYQPTYDASDVLSLTKIGADRFSGAMGVGGTNLDRQIGLAAVLDYSRTFADVHALSATIVAYADKYNETGVFQSNKHTHLGARFNYAFANKYIADFSSAIASTSKLAPGNRIAFSPSIGLGWVISQEDFLKDHSLIDYLKLKASGGIMHTDVGITRAYAYEDIYSLGGTVSWNDSNRGNNTTVLSNVGNPNLFYEKRKEINLGFEALLFDRALSVDFNVFSEVKSDLITVPVNSYPAHIGGLIPTTNFGENKYSGIELGLNWRKSLSNDLSFDIGPTLLFKNSEVVKRDEYWNEDYLYRAGRSTSAAYGLEALGFFRDDQDIASHAVQEFGEVQPGDIKYKDQNNDGFVNADDEIVIGDGSSSFVGGLNLRVKYKNFSFFALMTARDGADRFYTNAYYTVYGDRKYSEVVRDRWTPETAATATYPRLTSQSSSNNLRNSTFWLYDNSLISLNRMQLGYELPGTIASRLYAKSLSLYVRAYNVANFSKNQDRMELNVGTEPQYRSYLVGIKANF